MPNNFPTQPLTALIVDDNATNAQLISLLLKKIEGVLPLTFTDPVAALSWCEINTPDLILLDYMMPELNGLEFIERFRALPKNEFIPIIMVSAALEREIRLKALQLTANDFLNKPLDSVEFSARVKNMLALRKSQLRLAAASDEKLSNREKQYRAVIEATKDGFLVFDMQGKILEANASYSRLSGYSQAALLSMNIAELNANMTPTEAAEKIQKIVTQGHARYETVHKTCDGKIWPAEVSVSFIPGTEERCFSFIHDISRRKQDEEQLRKLSQAVEQSPNSCIISDTRGIVEYVNAAFTHITGYAAHEVVGRKVGFLKSGETPAETYIELWKKLGNGEVWQGEFINKRKNGERFNDLSIISPIRQEDGEITHYVSIQKDITEKKLIEEEVDLYRRDLENLVLQRTSEYLEAKSQAEAASRAKTDFLANMSHEIRTPMNAIIGFNALCLRTDVNEKQKDYLTKIGSAAQSLLHIINDILDLSKIESGLFTLESIPLNISQTLNDISNLVSALATDKGLTIELDIAPEIPAEGILGDALRLQQVLLNLCSNAIKFTQHGTIYMRCQVESRARETLVVRFSVQDSGIGISPQQIPMLFHAFTQADASTTRRFGGSGLGLSICKGLVEKMGGRIWVESEPGQGSNFIFTVQFALGEHQPQEADNQLTFAQLEQQMRRLRGAKVLVVEDNAFNQQVARDLLVEYGLQVDVAENGLVAIEKIERQNYDVVLMDIQMPVMDGYTATRLIRQNPHCQTLPIIALTASVLRSEKDICLQAGMNDRLAKPIVPEHLFSALLSWVKYTQPAATEMDSAPQPLATLPSTEKTSARVIMPGINAEPVIQRMRSNVVAYRRLLALFCQQFQNAAEPLQKALSAQDFETARRLAHTVKGSAATVGADDLGDVAGRLEIACKQGSSECAALLTEFETALNIVLAGQKSPSDET